jgi:hypothetical protein
MFRCGIVNYPASAGTIKFGISRFQNDYMGLAKRLKYNMNAAKEA